MPVPTLFQHVKAPCLEQFACATSAMLEPEHFAKILMNAQALCSIPVPLTSVILPQFAPIPRDLFSASACKDIVEMERTVKTLMNANYKKQAVVATLPASINQEATHAVVTMVLQGMVLSVQVS